MLLCIIFIAFVRLPPSLKVKTIHRVLMDLTGKGLRVAFVRLSSLKVRMTHWSLWTSSA
jgi:hypothetical protein